MPKREVNLIVRIVRSVVVTCFVLLSREGVLYANGLLKTWLMPDGKIDCASINFLP